MAKLTEEEWRAQYKEHMIARGVAEETAQSASENVEIGPHWYALEDDPEEAADEEMSCWGGD